MKTLIFPSEVQGISTLVGKARNELERMERGDPSVNLETIQRDLENALARLSELSGVIRGVWNNSICKEPNPSIADASPVLSLAGIQVTNNQTFRMKVIECSFVGRFYELFVWSESLGYPVKLSLDNAVRIPGAMDQIFPKLLNPLVPCGEYRLDEVYYDRKHFYLLSSV